MCLAIEVENPDLVLEKDIYRDHEFVITHNKLGHRCGYVRAPNGHPFHGMDISDAPVECHGGVTFAQADVACDKPGDDNAWWLGFDCAHAGDAPDPELQSEAPEGYNAILSRYGIVRTQEYVRVNCHDMIDQVIDAAEGILRA